MGTYRSMRQSMRQSMRHISRHGVHASYQFVLIFCFVFFQDASTKAPLVTVIDVKLLLPHVPVLLERGLSALLAEVRLLDLRRLFSLCSRVRSLDLLRDCVSLHVRQRGEALVAEVEREKTLVEDLLAFHAQVYIVCHIC